MTNTAFQTFHELRTILDNISYSKDIALKITKLLDQRSIAVLLGEAACNSSILSTITQYSYVHQLGFEKYNLIFSPKTGISLRLHFWPQIIGNAQEDIHDHCADFCSRVLVGDLVHLCYTPAVGADEYFEYSYILNPYTRISNLTCLGTNNLQCTSVEPIAAPNIYFFEKNILHRVKSPVTETLTLSLWGPRTKKATVYREKYTAPESGIGRHPLTVADVGKRFEYIKNLLG